ncbi:MAG: hypothetical protein AUG17_01065 [Crenarchaeota archaeon 13_1_20CM_2_53_14]|nr:MAG: hypothetical protein AUG17_01065 [Crenarchaeota archaeon 13_1_20CM_2_53_14]
MPKPIIKGVVRVLRPTKYELLWKGARSQENQTRLDALLLTGLRYVEAQRLQQNEEWLDGRFIHIPEYAQEEGQAATAWTMDQTKRQRTHDRPLFLQDQAASVLERLES